MQSTIFFSLFSVSFVYFLYQIYKRIRLIQSGQPDYRTDHPRKRMVFFLKQVILQRNLKRFPSSAIFHSFIMWGFVILFLSSIDMAWFGLFHTRIPFIGTNPVFIISRNLFLALAATGILGFTLRRLFFKPEWLHNSFNSYQILALIFAIIGSDFFFLLLEPNPGGNSVLPIQANFFWWVHFLLIFSFFFIIPRSKHLHLIFAPFNIYWHSLKPKGALQPVGLDLDMEQSCGVKRVEDFTWKQLLDTFSCVKCGICHSQCPAQQSNERLKPKRINGRIRSYLEEEGYKKDSDQNQKSGKVVGGLFDLDFISNCTTCGGCNNACPVSVDHVSKIIDMRRTIVSEKLFSPQAEQVFKGIENYGNPWGKEHSFNINDPAKYSLNGLNALNLPTISEKTEAEYLFFIGCQGRFDESAEKVSIAFANLLQAAGVDFAILGDKEWCCGETVRRMGNELLFQKTVHKNITQFNKLGVKKILTTCPHCFNTLKNEYPQFGGYYQVIPHSVFLADLLRQKKLRSSQLQDNIKMLNQSQAEIPIETLSQTVTQIKNQDLKIAYHDPCYLSHHNNLFQEAREVLQAFPENNLIELSRTKELSFCCGAGGGRFWESRNSENLITQNRVNEILAKDVDLLVTSCPYCKITLTEELNKRKPDEKNKKIQILDIVELCL